MYYLQRDELKRKKKFLRLQMQFFRNEELKQELYNVDKLTEERLDELLDMFLKDFEAGEVDARGWPAAFAAILAAKQPALRVNCVHPGYIKTDIT